MRITAFIVCALLGGCSVLGGGSPAHPVVTTDCPQAGPTFDTIGAVGLLAGGAAIAVADASTSSEWSGVATVLVAAPMAVTGLVYALSARYGWKERRRCKALLER